MSTKNSAGKAYTLLALSLFVASCVVFWMSQRSTTRDISSPSGSQNSTALGGNSGGISGGVRKSNQDLGTKPMSDSMNAGASSSYASSSANTGGVEGNAGPVQSASNGLTDPLPEPALLKGERVSEVATVGGQCTPSLQPNQWGAFPRVYIPQAGKAKVELSFPEAEVGDQVVVAVNDGGHLDDGKPARSFQLDQNKQVSFGFEANREFGYYRLAVRHAGQVKTIQFWAGDRGMAANR